MIISSAMSGKEHTDFRRSKLCSYLCTESVCISFFQFVLGSRYLAISSVLIYATSL